VQVRVRVLTDASRVVVLRLEPVANFLTNLERSDERFHFGLYSQSQAHTQPDDYLLNLQLTYKVSTFESLPTYKCPVYQWCTHQYCILTNVIISESDDPFLRATAVPAGTAKSAYYLWEFCLSVRHDPVRIQGQVR